jgi:predicted PurR-regulated permease PerM
MSGDGPSSRAVLRVVLIVVGVVLGLYLVYRLRQPITWLFTSLFLAVALSRPVNYLDRFMRRGFAIMFVYLGLFAAVVGIGLLFIPPIVSEVNDLADNAPRYAQDVRDYVQENERLRKLEEDYDITTKLEEEAGKLPERIGGAAGTLRDVGFGIVNSIFALVTILVLTAFMLGSGSRWIDQILALRPPERAARERKVLDDMANAVSGYVAGAVTISVIDGTVSFVVLTILGVPFAAPLAVVMGVMSLIPLIGATIGAVIVGIVTAFHDFPTTTIIWTIYAILYQQFENNIVQPLVQRRMVQLHPLAVLVAVLFGAKLFGVLGAIVAIPVAASIKIMLEDWWAYRRETTLLAKPPSPSAPSPPPPGPAQPEPG